MTQTLEQEKVETAVADGEWDRFAHLFKKADIERAMFDGATITALCGKKDVPTRDFTKFPKCETCQEVLNERYPE